MTDQAKPLETGDDLTLEIPCKVTGRFTAIGRTDPLNNLVGDVWICGIHHHLELIEVQIVNSLQCAVDHEDSETLNQLYRVVDPSSPFQTVTLLDREYVLFVTPAA